MGLAQNFEVAVGELLEIPFFTSPSNDPSSIKEAESLIDASLAEPPMGSDFYYSPQMNAYLFNWTPEAEQVGEHDFKVRLTYMDNRVEYHQIHVGVFTADFLWQEGIQD